MQLLYEQCYSQLNNKFSNDDDKNESNLKLNPSMNDSMFSCRITSTIGSEIYGKISDKQRIAKFRKKLKISNNESEEINILMQSKLDSAERRLKDNRIRIDELEEQCLKEVKNRRKIQRELDYANQLISNNHHITIKQDNDEQMLN
ncbi:hypothetical protein RDWZM_008484 [Blomia tropicalis]|uniref:Uncharacterized protein n=1 Tax=Blomia tropicalis TaxID=40697 RepID=A0A9Q0M1U2_BLOTA|nr:hypothetical protein RDWZM_008484 [Blomia tropicalis]